MIAGLPFLLALVLASRPATPVASAPVPEPPAIELVLVRHAEVAVEPGPDPGLGDDGRARVACLVETLKGERLTHVVTSPWRRARETAGPIAAAHDLEAVARDPLDAKVLAAELVALPAGSVALVVGHSNTLPALVTELGGTLEGLVEERGQPALPRDQFDRLVRARIRRGTEGEPARLLDLQDARQPPCPRPD